MVAGAGAVVRSIDRAYLEYGELEEKTYSLELFCMLARRSTGEFCAFCHHPPIVSCAKSVHRSRLRTNDHAQQEGVASVDVFSIPGDRKQP